MEEEELAELKGSKETFEVLRGEDHDEVGQDEEGTGAGGKAKEKMEVALYGREGARRGNENER